MENERNLFNKINSEKGETSPFVLVLLGTNLIISSLSLLALSRISDNIDDIKNSLEATPTPTPAGIDINSFENSFTSDQLTPTPEPTP